MELKSVIIDGSANDRKVLEEAGLDELAELATSTFFNESINLFDRIIHSQALTSGQKMGAFLSCLTVPLAFLRDSLPGDCFEQYLLKLKAKEFDPIKKEPT